MPSACFRFRIACAVFGLCCASVLYSQNGVATGDVKLATGEVVPNAWVTVGRQVDAGPAGDSKGMGPVVASAMVTRNGQFSLPALADGEYFACASTRIGGVLPSCQWGGQPTAFTVRNGAAAALHFQLRKGSTLKVHVDDPGKAFEKSKNGVFSDLILHVAEPSGIPTPILPT